MQATIHIETVVGRFAVTGMRLVLNGWPVLVHENGDVWKVTDWQSGRLIACATRRNRAVQKAWRVLSTHTMEEIVAAMYAPPPVSYAIR